MRRHMIICLLSLSALILLSLRYMEEPTYVFFRGLPPAMIFRVTTEGDPIRHIHFTFDAEGLDSFLTELSNEHFWWPYQDATVEETAYYHNTPQHVDQLDVFVDDGCFPALRAYPLAVIIEPGNERPCERLSLIGTHKAYEKHLHAPIRHMQQQGQASTEVPSSEGTITLHFELQHTIAFRK